jgi:glycerate dehydrogenase
MKIVILDGFAVNPGDLSWEKLAAQGELTVYEHSSADTVIARAQDAEAVFTNKTVLTAQILNALSACKYIGLLSTGTNVVDLAAARTQGITVTNIPAYSTASVAQLVFAFILELANHVQIHSDSVHGGDWTRSRDFCYWKTPLTELAGKTLGIVGYGQIGQAVAKIARAFEMRVLACANPASAAKPGLVTFAEVLENADILTFHCPLTPQTEGLLNRETIARMKDGAWIINASRGGILQEADVAVALASGKLGGAAVDVLSVEPPRTDNPLLTAKNCLITPHLAWATREARSRLIAIAAENLRAFLAGEALHIVN